VKRLPAIRRVDTGHRPGITIIELLMSGILLTFVVVLVSPQLLRCGQLRQSAAQRQLATQIASNVLERLDARQPRPAAVAAATSGWNTDTWLPELELSVELDDREGQRRVTIAVGWSTSSGQPARPVRLTGWLSPSDPGTMP
tara:strand:- start:3113 stop:3538 length:426 start_codon:yes stop_codon:yes gene_type:complete